MISIIIPSYNYGGFIDKAIDSCFDQVYNDIEVIVVNDGSTDNTEQIINKYTGNITYISQKNMGVSGARNVGAKVARGEWLLFLDADDQLIESGIADLVNCSKITEAGVIFGKVKQYKGNKLAYRFNQQLQGEPPHPAKATFYETLIVTPGSAIVKKDVFNQAGGFKVGLPCAEDRHFWLKCGVLTAFKFCDTDVVLKKIHKGCASWNINLMIYSGYIAQREFLSWCSYKQIDLSFIQATDIEIAERNVKRAIWYKAWDAIHAIVLHAKIYNISSVKLTKCTRILTFSKVLPSSITARLISKVMS